jgi:hypothetical protein
MLTLSIIALTFVLSILCAAPLSAADSNSTDLSPTGSPGGAPEGAPGGAPDGAPEGGMSCPGGVIQLDIPDYYAFQEKSVNKIDYGFLKSFRVPTWSYPSVMLIEDLDGDGKKEVLFKNSAEQGISEGKATEQKPAGAKTNINILDMDLNLLATIPLQESADQVDSIAALDVNGDGKKELFVMANGSLGGKRIYVFDNGKEVARHTVEGSGTGQLFVGDIDGDQIEEVIAKMDGKTCAIKDGKIVEVSDDKLLSLKARDEITLELKEKYTGQNLRPDPKNPMSIPAPSYRLMIGEKTYKTSVGLVFEEDVDGDGKNEVIVTTADPTVTCVSATRIFMFNADGELIWNEIWPTWLGSMMIDDLDGDGAKEIVFSDHESQIAKYGRSDAPQKKATFSQKPGPSDTEE